MSTADTTALPPVSIQLHTLRTEMARDVAATIRRVAEIGFRHVEPAGLFNLSPREFRAIVEDSGMRIGSSHAPWANQVGTQEAVDIAGELGVDQVACGYMQEAFAGLDAIRRTADEVNRLRESLAAAGLGLFMHNHWWEYAPLHGRLAIDHFLDHCPEIDLELDLYWAAHYGDNDVPGLMRRLGDRITLLHVKDGDFSRDQQAPLCALGDGRMDLEGCLRETDRGKVRYLVFEMDRCATDLWEATRKSFIRLQELTSSITVSN